MVFGTCQANLVRFIASVLHVATQPPAGHARPARCRSHIARRATKDFTERLVQGQTWTQSKCITGVPKQLIMHSQAAMRNFALFAQDNAFLQNLLLWFQHDNGDASDCIMLDLICALTQQQGVPAKLCSLGLPAILDELCATASPEVKRSANKAVTALIQSDSACFSQQPGQQAQQLSPHDPQSRCQSNSPPFRANAQVHRTQQAPEGDRSWLHKPVKQITHARSNSHAFGSQQGKLVFRQHVFAMFVALSCFLLLGQLLAQHQTQVC